MNNFTIENWFPRPIYYVDDVCSDELDNLERSIKEIAKESGTGTTKFLGVQSTHQTNSELHKKPEFRLLCDTINKHVFNFSTILGYSPERSFKLNFGNMWTNISNTGGYNFPHTHPGSIISGAFYVKTAPGNTICFYDKYEVLSLPDNKTMYCGDPVVYQCIPSRLILFKADFIHGNPPQESVGEKIVISFNMVF